jgi:nitrite reductase/ring-hydroxylating ferredoxin subunit
MESHKGGVELVSIEDGVVRLRLRGSCSGCPSSTMTLKLAIEDAIYKAAPDIDEIVADGVVAETPLPQVVQVGWAETGPLGDIAGAEVRPVDGEDVLFARIGNSTYAYRPPCPACNEPLGAGSLQGTELACGACGARFDAIRAGRCLDQPQLQLEPVPLLGTKVALA